MRSCIGLRKATKWGGTAATLVLVAGWIAGWWWHPFLMPTTSSTVSLVAGGVLYYGNDHIRPDLLRRRRDILAEGRELVWRFHRSENMVHVPTWPLIALVTVATSIAWRRDIVLRRRAARGECESCGYTRAGIDAGAVCPECGRGPGVKS